jgi:hypothetical protein
MNEDPRPEERRRQVYAACVDLAASRVSKDEARTVTSWFETAQGRLLTMRGDTDVGDPRQKEGPREAGLETIDESEIDQAVLL